MCKWENEYSQIGGMGFLDFQADNKKSIMNHRQINVRGVSVHVVMAGDPGRQAILFLHGYPENWAAFEDVMHILKDNYYVLAIDLPGIGLSEPIASCDKRSMANFIGEVIQALGLERIILAGHDIGGMTTYAFVKQFPEKLVKAIIMDTAIPGVAPWEEVKRNPYIWHFAFYAVPDLPEILVTGKQRPLFDYFYNALSFNKQAIGEKKRQAYAKAYESAAALKTSFGWYRAFAQDEKDNAGCEPVDLSVLYIRGEKETGDIKDYVEGLQKSGLHDLSSRSVAGCGHFAPEEQPELVAKAIHDFITL
jgi:pimeloyl-ACP methyl ester carboxylesterase